MGPLRDSSSLNLDVTTRWTDEAHSGQVCFRGGIGSWVVTSLMAMEDNIVCWITLNVCVGISSGMSRFYPRRLRGLDMILSLATRTRSEACFDIFLYAML